MQLIRTLLLLASIAAACRIGPPVRIGAPTVQIVVVDGKPFQIHHGEWVESIVCDTARDTTEKK